MELQTNIDSGDVKIKRTTEPSGVTETTITKEPDLVTRVSQVKVEPKVETKPDDSIFNVNDIEKIQDPQAKEYALKAYKSLQGDYTRKSQALAEERKRLEAEKLQKEQWTPEKVQSLLNNSEFIQAAQSVAGKAEDDFSTLSETEKRRIAETENLAKIAIRQNAELLRQQQDGHLQTKYANYNPQAIDILTADMIAGRVQATREHLHKVLDYDDAILRAYELGKQDKKLENLEKTNIISPEGGTITETETVPAIEKDETNKAYFMRLAARRLAAFAQGGIKK